MLRVRVSVTVRVCVKTVLLSCKSQDTETFVGERNKKCPLKQTRASAIINEFILVEEYSYTISRTLWYLFLLYHKIAAIEARGVKEMKLCFLNIVAKILS